MISKIAYTGLLWEDAQGQRVRQVIDGSNEDSISRRRVLDPLVRPLRIVETYVELEDGTKVSFKFDEIARIIPDRTGVLVIFEPGSYTHPDGTDVFPAPNNAAIYNADGSLRFQLRIPLGHIVDRIAAIHGGAIVSPKFKDMMGVLIATDKRGPPEYVYVIDPSQPELISTGQWVRW